MVLLKQLEPEGLGIEKEITAEVTLSYWINNKLASAESKTVRLSRK